MEKIIRSLAIILVLFLSADAHAARVLDANQSPWRLNWSQIETEHFIILFPDLITDDARNVADYMENIYPHITKTIGEKSGKTTIILNTTLSETNGYASIAPTKSEWFNDPGQTAFAGSVGWYELLGIHEYRHILQFESLKKKTTYVLSVLFGEEVSGALSFYSTPGWFFEGDAVLAETLLSNSGRGRVPEFDAEFRAQLLSGKRFGYYKAINGSYGEYDPLASPYLLGYFMTSKIRKSTYGNVFAHINNKASWLPLPYFYNAAVRKYTRKNITDIYEDMLDELSNTWGKRNSKLVITASTPLVRETKEQYRKYSCPFEADDGTVIAFRTGMNVNTGIVKIDINSGDESVLERTYPRDSKINYNNGKIVWSESIPHVRWGMESYSDVFIMDIKDDSVSRVTSGRKISAPSLSPDGKHIIAVEIGEDNICNLVCLEVKSGENSFKIPFPKNEFVRTPKYSADGQHIVYSVTDRIKGIAVYMSDSEGKDPRILIPYSNNMITSQFMNSDFLFYVSSYSGIDNVYAMNLKTKKRYQVTSRPFGAYMPSISRDGEKIIFSDVTSDGYIPSEIKIDPDKWIPIEKIGVDSLIYCEPLIDQEKGSSVIENYPAKDRSVESYMGINRLFGLHSWYVIPNTTQKDISVKLISTNMLSTLNTTAGYTYNYNEKTHSGNASLSYAGVYPVFNLSGIYGKRTSSYIVGKNDGVADNEETKFYSWDEKTVKGTVHLPLNLSRGLFFTGLDIGSDIRYTDIENLNYLKSNKNNNGKFIPVTYWMNFYNLSTEYGYILPKWGQVLNVSYSHSPINQSDYKADLLSTDGYLYLPGLIRRTNLYIEAGYEFQNTDNYRYSSKLLFARGYDAQYFKYLYKGSANYTFPLFYPDQNILWIFYAKRLYMNLYGDYCVGKEHDNYYKFRSSGFETMLEFNPFNIPLASIHLGYRFAYKFDDEKKNYHGVVVLIGISE